jgi:hypothetical protein
MPPYMSNVHTQFAARVAPSEGRRWGTAGAAAVCAERTRGQSSGVPVARARVPRLQHVRSLPHSPSTARRAPPHLLCAEQALCGLYVLWSKQTPPCHRSSCRCAFHRVRVVILGQVSLAVFPLVLLSPLSLSPSLSLSLCLLSLSLSLSLCASHLHWSPPQDPYHAPGQAMGLCFSVPRGTKLPSSLNNMYKELHTDLGVPKPTHGDLHAW